MITKNIYTAFLAFYFIKNQKFWILKSIFTLPEKLGEGYSLFIILIYLTGVLVPTYLIWRGLDFLIYKRVSWSAQFEDAVYLQVKLGVFAMWAFIVLFGLLLLSLIIPSPLAWLGIPVLAYSPYVMLFILITIESGYLAKRFSILKNA